MPNIKSVIPYYSMTSCACLPDLLDLLDFPEFAGDPTSCTVAFVVTVNATRPAAGMATSFPARLDGRVHRFWRGIRRVSLAHESCPPFDLLWPLSDVVAPLWLLPSVQGTSCSILMGWGRITGGTRGSRIATDRTLLFAIGIVSCIMKTIF